MTLPDKTSTPFAIVTGATRGIGLELCGRLAGLGYAVALRARDVAQGEEAARRLGKQVTALRLDVTLDDDGPTGGFFQDGEPLPW